MIYSNITMTVTAGDSRINEKIILYRGDREVEVIFEILQSAFKFAKGENVIDNTKAAYGQLIIDKPNEEFIFSDMTACEDGKVKFTITGEMIDELGEVGLYGFQIRLYDEARTSRITLPPVNDAIEVREPMADDGGNVGISVVGDSRTVKGEAGEDIFDEDGSYNKTIWANGDVITDVKLNKLEDAMYAVNEKADNAETPSLDGYATEKYVDDAVAGVDVTDQLTNYATKDYVNGEISTIELIPGPQGPQGKQGPKGERGVQGPRGEKGDTAIITVADQPIFVDSVDYMTDINKIYVTPDGHMYANFEQFTPNHNLLKISEVMFNSRLQNDVEGTVSSTVNNAVTGWIPVEYGKFYSFTMLFDGERLNYKKGGYGTMVQLIRLNIRLSDGSIVVYNKDSADMAAVKKLYTDNLNYSFTIPIENAVEMRIHFSTLNTQYDISNADLLRTYQPMIVAGYSAIEAFEKSRDSEYIEGEEGDRFISEWRNTGLSYNQPAEYDEEIIELQTDVTNLQNDVTGIKNMMTNPASTSPYYRDVNYGILPVGYYQGVGESYDALGFKRGTTYSTYINLWKSMVADHSGYVTETELGTASDGQSIYLYDFKPVRVNDENKQIPKIIIIAGQHGFEKSNVYGLYFFVDNLLNRWTKHPALEYLRNHVELMIVPVLNTYGFDNRQYKNANGVNTNRNFESNWEFLDDPTSPQYGGQAPFDQPETQIVRDLLNSYKTAALVLDFHTNGGECVTQYIDVNWCAICQSNDDYYNRMKYAIPYHISAITAHFNLDYELNQPNVMMGRTTIGDGTGLLRKWAYDNKFLSVLVEGFNGFPNDVDCVGKIFKANEEILVNYLITTLTHLSK